MQLESPRNAWKLFLLLAAAVLALAWSVAVIHVRNVNENTLEAAQLRVQTLARVHAEHAELTLTVADEALRHLRDIAQQDKLAAFRDEARRISGAHGGGPINRATLIGPDGWAHVNFIDGQERPPVFLGDREHFLAAQRSSEDRIVVSEPIVGKTTGEWILLFARPILQRGKFAGAVVVGFPVARLGEFFDTLDHDRELLTLLSPTGRVILRSHDQGRHVGKPVTVPAPAETFPLTSPLDGVTRLSAVRELASWGLRVVAGIDQRWLDRENAEHARVAYLPAILLSLLLLPASWLVYRAGRKLQAAHDALQYETTRSRTVFETMSEGLLLLDPRGVVTFTNPRAAQWFPQAAGRRLADLLRDAGFALVTQDGAPFASDDPIAHLCLDAGENVDDAWLKRGGDDALWLSLSARACRDADGAVSGATLTLVDRSDEHARLTESALAAGIIDGMHDAVMITDAKGQILRTNPAFVWLTGYHDDEVIGKTPTVLSSGRHDDAYFREMWETLNRQGYWSGRVWNRRPSGEEYCVWHNITSVRDVHGRIARFITVSRDITEQETREGELWQRANFDPLTGLANRTRFDDRLAQTVAGAQRDGHAFAVLYLDLDRFKPVNDTLGHAAGDALLRQASQRMRSILRSEDTLARIGGDEFALILPRISGAGDTARVAAKIIDLIDAPFDLAEGTVSIGISIGIAVYPDDGRDATALGHSADLALYAAKAGGRNCWRFAEHATQEQESE
ncbi:diguanylate cyclase domain-containing protein [Azospira restricta]|uniref:Diguanylate cyclase n=1 Tax=Azospira restricta TaxID=404405 RepID=A0A974SP33_9RHOO|nr:diguanylate cyclase [Azospira restricta]QRJ63836.1 diguanylate cyclase [Azospira restricta]